MSRTLPFAGTTPTDRALDDAARREPAPIPPGVVNRMLDELAAAQAIARAERELAAHMAAVRAALREDRIIHRMEMEIADVAVAAVERRRAAV